MWHRHRRSQYDGAMRFSIVRVVIVVLAVMGFVLPIMQSFSINPRYAGELPSLDEQLAWVAAVELIIAVIGWAAVSTWRSWRRLK
jgi:hypothetical protein